MKYGCYYILSLVVILDIIKQGSHWGNIRVELPRVISG